MLIGFHILNIMLYCGLTAYKWEIGVNGRELTKRERKHCCARAYIYAIMITSNIIWAICLTSAADEIVQGLEIGYGIFIIFCFYVDLRFVKCKNLKYACKSYFEDPDSDDDTRSEVLYNP